MDKENESRIDRLMVVSGIVECHGRMVVEGVLEGSVTGGIIEITETGRLSGEVAAESIDCAGRLEGNIVTDSFILRRTGCHVGTAETRKLTVDPGAVLDCVLQSGTVRSEKPVAEPSGKAAAPAVHLSRVLTAFQDGRPCCMDIPWSARLELFTHLLDLLEKGKPLIKVTGERGSGKSVLAEKVRRSLPAGYEVLSITDTTGSVAALLQGVAAGLAVTGAETLSQSELLARVKEVLAEKRSRGLRVVALVDDAQEMYPATMEGIVHLLTNGCGGGDGMLQIILFGTKEMETKMADTIALYFKAETGCRLSLEPMSIKDTADYLRLCLQLAAVDNAGASVALFPYETIRTLHVLSRGNLAEINRLADGALHAAHAAGAAEVYPDFL